MFCSVAGQVQRQPLLLNVTVVITFLYLYTYMDSDCMNLLDAIEDFCHFKAVPNFVIIYVCILFLGCYVTMFFSLLDLLVLHNICCD